MTRQEKTRLVVLIIAIGFLLSLVFHLYQAYFLGHSYPSSTFLFDPKDRGRDFFNIQNVVREWNPFRSTLSVYFPFAYVALIPFSILKGKIAYWGFLLTFFFVVFSFLSRQLTFLSVADRRSACLTITFLSYPVLFCADRGNLEILVFFFLVFFFRSLHGSRPWLGVFFIAGAAAMKLYPGVFALFYVLRKDYRRFWIVAVLTLVLTFGAAATYPGGIDRSIGALMSNLKSFKEQFIYGEAGLQFNSSYFGLLKLILRPFFELNPAMIQKINSFYTLACLSLFGFVFWFIRSRETVFWKQVTLLTLTTILFPQVSFDYKLIHLLLPLAFYLADPEPSKFDRRYSVIFGLLLVPKAYFWISGSISIGVVINPLLMTALAVLIFREGFQGSSRNLMIVNK